MRRTHIAAIFAQGMPGIEGLRQEIPGQYRWWRGKMLQLLKTEVVPVVHTVGLII
jgi:hypothetical protein